MKKAPLFMSLTASVFLLGQNVTAAPMAQSSLDGNVSGYSVIKISTADDARGFVENMTQTGLAFLSDEGLSQAQKTEFFRKLLNKSFDLNAIGKFTIGRYWKQMSSAQQKEYLGLFGEMVVRSYSKRFNDYQGQTIEVTGARESGKNEAFVESLINNPDGGEPVKVVWRVRDKDGQLNIIDVVVSGVSMSVTQRSDFASVIQRGGGDVEALLTHLRK